jgi:hypothetical protein
MANKNLLGKPREIGTSLFSPLRRKLYQQMAGRDVDERLALDVITRFPVLETSQVRALQLFPPNRSYSDTRHVERDFRLEGFEYSTGYLQNPWYAVDMLFGNLALDSVVAHSGANNGAEHLHGDADRIRILFSSFAVRAAAGEGVNLENPTPLSADSTLLLAHMPLYPVTPATAQASREG